MRVGASGAVGTSGDIAIVVRPDLPIDNLSFAELRKLLIGDRQFWSSSLRVTLLMRAPVAREREVILKNIYQMSEAQFRQFWISKVFRAEATNGPKVVFSNEMATELVAAIPGAVAFVDAAKVPQRSEEHTSELQSPDHLVCRLLLEKKKKKKNTKTKE